MIKNDMPVGKGNIFIVLCYHTFVVYFSFIILLFLLFLRTNKQFCNGQHLGHKVFELEGKLIKQEK